MKKVAMMMSYIKLIQKVQEIRMLCPIPLREKKKQRYRLTQRRESHKCN